MKVVYRRYASLFFIAGVELDGEVSRVLPLRRFRSVPRPLQLQPVSLYAVFPMQTCRMSWDFWNSSTRLWKHLISTLRMWYVSAVSS